MKPSKSIRRNRLRLEELESRLAPANDLFFVPLAAPNVAEAQLRFTLLETASVPRSEVGVFAVDDGIGTVNGVDPTDPSYAAVALSRAVPVFRPDATRGGVNSLFFEAGKSLGFYLVSGGTMEQARAGQRPVFFSIDAANGDGIEHVIAEAKPNNAQQLRFEDATGGGDRDFDDVILAIVATGQTRLIPPPPPPAPVPPVPAIPGGSTIASADVNGDAFIDTIVGTGVGVLGHVKVNSGKDGSELFSFNPYAGFNGGVNVAAGDVNNDGKIDIITGTASGVGHVKVFSGADGTLLQSFLAYDGSNTGGAFVAAGDFNGDSRADIVTGAGEGSSQLVKVFSGADQAVLQSFTAYDGFTGGTRVGVGDVNEDGRVDIITGAGPGSSAHVKVFSGQTGNALLQSFLAFDGFSGGVFVAAGDKNKDGNADIIVGAGSGTSPHVKVFSGADGSELRSFFAYDNFLGGVAVAAVAVNGDSNILTAPALGPTNGHVRIFSGNDTLIASFLVFSTTTPPSFGTQLDSQAPTATFSLTSDTGSSSTDKITTNPQVVATLSEDKGTITSVKARIDSQSDLFDVTSSLTNNTVTFNTALLQTVNNNVALPQGAHTLFLQATDSAGNISAVLQFAFTFDTTAPAAPTTLNLSTATDTGLAGDFRTDLATVELTGNAEANATVELRRETVPGVPGSGTALLTTTANASGVYTFSNVSLPAGASSFTVRAIDAAGNGNVVATLTQTFTRVSAPTVQTDIADFTMAVGDANRTFDLLQAFDDAEQIVRFTTNFPQNNGNIDINLFNQTPITRDNFVTYVNNANTAQDYDGTVIHRATTGAGLQIIQGGGFNFNPAGTNTINGSAGSKFPRVDQNGTFPQIQNEPGVSNSRGTIAMAKGGSPDSATNQFFFNVGDNSRTLDSVQNSGGFTVFGQVIGGPNAGLAVLDAINALQKVLGPGAPSGEVSFPVRAGANTTNFPTNITANDVVSIQTADVLTEAQRLTFSIQSAGTTSVAVPTITAGTTLSVQAVASGDSTFVVRATDQDGMFLDMSITVRVRAVTAPSVSPVTTNEDTQASGLVVTPTGADGSQVTHFKVSGITNGSLFKNDGTPLPDNAFITAAEGAAGLKFTPATDFNGTGSFVVQSAVAANDAALLGPTGSGTITIDPVNDAPQFDLTAADVPVAMDSGDATLGGFVVNIVPGPATATDEAGQALTFTTANDNNTLFSTQPSVALDGTLTFTPAAGQTGTATVFVSLKDDGGVANGIDTTIKQFTITVT